MKYFHRDGVVETLKKMSEFELMLKNLFDKFNLSLRENTGRRNNLMSQAHEKFFTDLLVSSGYDAICSGRTGEPDIYIRDIDRELECKLSSSSSHSWPLQCDYSTLTRKGSLDFLYVLCDKNFNKFAVLLFDSLSIDDFHYPAPGSRQKSRMNKSRAMEKCTPIIGNIENINDKLIEKYETDYSLVVEKMNLRIDEIKSRIASSKSLVSIEKDRKLLKRESDRFLNRQGKIQSKIKMWSNKPAQYKIHLEDIS